MAYKRRADEVWYTGVYPRPPGQAIAYNWGAFPYYLGQG